MCVCSGGGGRCCVGWGGVCVIRPQLEIQLKLRQAEQADKVKVGQRRREVAICLGLLSAAGNVNSLTSQR